MDIQDNSVVTDVDTEILDGEITQISNDFSETYYLDGEQEEELEMLVAKAMKLGELYERKKWQAAKAQAVPEGFVLVEASDRDQEMLELIDQRDHMENQAEQLKDKLQNLYGVDFGEHSNCNFPFQNAIDFDDSDLVLLDKKELRDTYYWDGSEYVVDHPSEYEMELERGEITTLEKWQRTKETNVYCANIYSNEDDFEIVQFESLEEAKKAVAANKAMIEAQEQKG